MAFCWRAHDGSLIVVLGSPSPHQLKNKKKNGVKVGPHLTKLSGSVHVSLAEPTVLMGYIT